MDDRARRLMLQSIALAAVLAGYHVLLARLMRSTGLVLGAVGPGTKVYRLVPLYMYVAPHFKTGLLLAVALLAAYWCWLRAYAWNPQRLARGFVPAAILWYYALAAAVALIDGGPVRLWRPFVLLRDTEYIGAVEHVQSIRQFLHDYVGLLAGLPLHCHTHPPGGTIVLWAVGGCIHPGAPTAALATIAAAGLAVPAVYGLAREALDERRARLAVGLFLLAPSVLLYTATSLDAVFMVPLVWTMCLLWKARDRRPWVLGALGGLTASLGAMMTFSAAFLVFWAAAMLAVTTIVDRPRIGNAVQSLAIAAAVSVVFYALVYLWSGYNLVENLFASFGFDRAMGSAGNPAAPRHSIHLMVANLAAFFAAVGLPTVVLFGRQSWRDLAGGEGASAGRWLNVTFLAALAVTVVAPLYTLEVERIWLFMVPLVVIAAARRLDIPTEAGRPSPEFRLTFGLLAAQVVLMEVFLETTW